MNAQAFPEIPGYTIKKALGQGGMARVYVATQDSFGRDIALKVMSTHLASDPMWGKRFLHEAQVVAQLSHPNIVPVFDVGHHNGYYYMSMELLKGGDLKTRLMKGVSIPETVRIIRQIAAGLDFAGEKGFVHRDIKPENIMFREDGSPVILDFGIAKQKNANNRMTQTGTIVGTTAYMSPEQAQGIELDERSDVYSLGIMFYEMLTGRTPFIGESSVAVLLKHVNEPAPPLPDHLDIFQPVMDLSLAKKPDERYNRSRDLARDLESLTEDVDLLFADAEPVIVTIGSEDQTAVASAATQANSRMTAARTSAKRTSAKATIHARKQAEQAKQRRKNMLGIAAAVLALGAPLSYLAYRQFVIAPQQEAQLKAEAGSARMATQQKIADLLADAGKQQAANKDDDPRISKQVVQLLQQVLVLEEKNEEALKLQQLLVDRHLAKTRSLLSEGKPLDAADHLAIVETLQPQHADLAALGQQLSEARNSSLTQQAEALFVGKKITELLAEAEQHVQKNRLFAPSGNCAWDTYQAALEFDPQNQEVKQAIGKLLDGLLVRTEQDIKNGQLALARQGLQLLQQHYSDKNRLQPLVSAIGQAEQKEAELVATQGASAIQSLLVKAAQLQKQMPATRVNDQLRAVWQQVLAADARNAEAQRGLMATSDYEKSLLDKALAERNQRAAQQHIAVIEDATPNYPGLAALREKVAGASRSSEQNADLLANADRLIAASSGSPEQARKKLKEAWDNIQNAKRVDPDGEWQVSKSALQGRYSDLVDSYIDAGDKDAAQLLLADARSNGLLNSRLESVQEKLGDPVEAAAEAPKKKKPIAVGGF